MLSTIIVYFTCRRLHWHVPMSARWHHWLIDQPWVPTMMVSMSQPRRHHDHHWLLSAFRTYSAHQYTKLEGSCHPGDIYRSTSFLRLSVPQWRKPGDWFAGWILSIGYSAEREGEREREPLTNLMFYAQSTIMVISTAKLHLPCSLFFERRVWSSSCSSYGNS